MSADIAIVGMSALFPGSTDSAGFWRDIVAGRDLMSDVPPGHWRIDDYFDPDPAAKDKVYARRGAFLDPVPFDPMEFGILPNAMPSTDSSQLLALIAAKRCLLDATGGDLDKLNRDRVSVILGVASATELVCSMSGRLQRPVWNKVLREAGLDDARVEALCDRMAEHYVPWQESTFPGLLGNVVAGRIANRLDLGGSNYVVDAACASSLSALAAGINELHLHKADLVLSGGVDALNDILMYACFAETTALSASGDCRPFSADADGTMLGEGVGMFAIRRLADAERDGNPIYAVIRGLGSSSDGRARSIYGPLPQGQAKALRRAYDEAGYAPASVTLVEAHGTGTVAGDKAEFEGLSQVFDGSGDEHRWCALGSVKSQIGHTKAAAGAAGLFKTIMALHHGVLPPTIKVGTPNADIDVDTSAFYLNTRARPWLAHAEEPRRASVSAFGFGGTNYHVTAEAYDGPGKRPLPLRSLPCELLPMSASNAQALGEQCERDAKTLDEGVSLTRAAEVAQRDFERALEHRAAVVATSRADAATKLRQLANALQEAPGRAFSLPAGVHYDGSATRADHQIAFLFPGQGSQYVYMGDELAMHFRQAQAAWSSLDADVAASVFPAPTFDEQAGKAQAARLTEMANAQPAIAACSVSQMTLLRAAGVEPGVVAGHSFGELTALHAAGCISADDLVRLAKQRGELMAAAAAGTDGAMLAVTSTHDEVAALIERESLAVVIANHNAPRQVVVSGETEAIELAATAFARASIATRHLKVASAFHSPLVSASHTPFAAVLADCDVGPPSMAVVANATAEPYPQQPAAIRAQLAEQLTRPVCFVEQIEALYAAGARTFIEVGPGNVLTGLVGQCLDGRAHTGIAVDNRTRGGVFGLTSALARLAVLGHAVDLSVLWSGFAEPPAAPKAGAHVLDISGANYGKPYPAGSAAQLQPMQPDAVPPQPPQPIQQTPVAPMQNELPNTLARVAREAVPAASAVAPLATTQLAATAPVSGDAQALYREVARVQAQFQQTLGSAHMAYLQIVQQTIAALGGQPAAAIQPAALPAPGVAAHTMAPPANSAVPTAVAANMLPATAMPAIAAAEALAPPATPVSAISSPATPVEVHANEVRPVVDMDAMLLALVAEKTGYPAEMLGLDMALEAELGIDSIKRVEILAAAQAQVPGLPDLNTTVLGEIDTLRAVADYLRAAMATQQSTAPPADATATQAQAAVDIDATLLALVAEKTGYPAEMLGLDMALEAELGIDSIKRVEILAAAQAQIPGLPDLDTAVLSELDTLRAVSEYLTTAASGKTTTVDRQATFAAPEVTTITTVRRATLARIEAAAPGVAMPGLREARSIVVTPDDGDIAPALAAALHAAGLAAVVMESPTSGCDALISLHGLREDASPATSLETHAQAFEAARCVAARFSNGTTGTYVTVHDSGGDFGGSGSAERAWSAGVTGIAKTARHEWPGASVRCIDIERAGRNAAQVAHALLDELLGGGDALEVGLGADGRRLLLKEHEASVDEEGDLPIGRADVVIVSGGARGIAAHCCEALGRACQPTFLLLGRTVLAAEPASCATLVEAADLQQALLDDARATGETLTPAIVAARCRAIFAAREVLTNIERIERTGSRVRYVSVDARDAEAVRAAVADARRDLGPIAGVIHAAGVLADKRIADKTAEQFERVFRAKVDGLQALLSATAQDSLRFMTLFGSVAGRYGNAGQCDYAAANEVLNRVALAEARQRGAACRVRVLNFGPWDGGMVTPQLRVHFKRLGVALIPLQAGADHFVNELRGGDDAVEVILAAGSAD